MSLVFILIGIAFLVAGLVGVWNRNWRIMWGAQAYMAAFVVGCWTVDYWYEWVGISRGDGFALLGIILFGSMAAAVSLAVLVVAGIIHSLRGNATRATDLEGKSEVA
jgi:hypothetical protein